MSKINLYIHVDTTRFGGEPIGSGSYCDREPEYISIDRIKIRKDIGQSFFGPDVRLENLDIPDNGSNVVRLAMIRYYDGDTFGSTSGYYKFLPFLYPITKNHFNINEEEQRLIKERGFTYFDWRGYFSGFEKIEYFEVDLNLLENSDELVFYDDQINDADYDIQRKEWP